MKNHKRRWLLYLVSLLLVVAGVLPGFGTKKAEAAGWLWNSDYSSSAMDWLWGSDDGDYDDDYGHYDEYGHDYDDHGYDDHDYDHHDYDDHDYDDYDYDYDDQDYDDRDYEDRDYNDRYDTDWDDEDWQELEDEIEEDEEYTSKEEVAAYLHVFGHLPDNFITKKEAKSLGWVSREGNLGEVAPGKSIGGDYFGNYEGNLPEKKGRDYYECDIDSDGGYRGAKRIIYSDDGLIFYTEDHYETFEQLY